MSKKITDINIFRAIWIALTEYSILGVAWDYLFQQVDLEDKSVRYTRRQICAACDDKIDITNQCSICGCWIKAKTMYTKSKCPVDKW